MLLNDKASFGLAVFDLEIDVDIISGISTSMVTRML